MLLESANLSAPSPVASSYRHLSASVARDDGLNVRAQPDPDAPVAGAIPRTEQTLKSQGSRWAPIKYKDITRMRK